MNSKLRPVISVVLLLVAGFLAYKVYRAIQKPIEFLEIKEERYAVVIDKLNVIRDLQVEYRRTTGDYSKSFDQLIAFADTGKVTIEERKDSSFVYYDKVFQTDMNKDTVVIRVIGYESVGEKVLPKGFNIAEMRYVPFTDKKEFLIDASRVERGGIELPTMEVIAYDRDIFEDIKSEYGQFIDKNGSLQLGNINEPVISGNWK